MVDDRPIMSLKYCLPVPVSTFSENYNAINVQRGLSAIAEHLWRYTYSECEGP